VKSLLTVKADEIQSPHFYPAERITRFDAQQPGAGRIFIGFRYSLTTGLAAHLAAPFVPTVESEAMDLQDQTLTMVHKKLLEFFGIVIAPFFGSFICIARFGLATNCIRSRCIGVQARSRSGRGRGHTVSHVYPLISNTTMHAMTTPTPRLKRTRRGVSWDLLGSWQSEYYLIVFPYSRQQDVPSAVSLLRAAGMQRNPLPRHLKKNARKYQNTTTVLRAEDFG
jgi:hypothetical protein